MTSYDSSIFFPLNFSLPAWDKRKVSLRFRSVSLHFDDHHDKFTKGKLHRQQKVCEQKPQKRNATDCKQYEKHDEEHLHFSLEKHTDDILQKENARQEDK